MIHLYNIEMKSDRSSRLISSRYVNKNKQSNSPTLASSYSEKSLWARSYKNQPFPGQLRRRLIGRRFNFQDFSDEEEENTAIVVEQQEQQLYQKKKRVLPHFKMISDRGEFTGNRSRIKSEKKFDYSDKRCRSVQSLKLPQVVEQKKQEEDQHKMELTKLCQFKDYNEFNLKGNLNNSSNKSHTQRSRESLEPNHFSSAVPEKIIENQAQQTRSQKLHNQKSILTTELEKLIVDQIDEKKRKKEQTEIQSIIQQQRAQEQIDTLNMLRLSLDKLESQAEYLTQHRDQISACKKSHASSEDVRKNSREKKRRRHNGNQTIRQIVEENQHQQINQ